MGSQKSKEDPYGFFEWSLTYLLRVIFEHFKFPKAIHGHVLNCFIDLSRFVTDTPKQSMECRIYEKDKIELK